MKCIAIRNFMHGSIDTRIDAKEGDIIDINERDFNDLIFNKLIKPLDDNLSVENETFENEIEKKKRGKRLKPKDHLEL